MTVEQLINRLFLVKKPDSKVIIYNNRADEYREVRSITVHADNDVEIGED